MTSPRRFEQDLPALLADLYVGGIPDYRDDLVLRVAATRQRAAWTIPERWIPMDIATTRVPVARMPWRQLGVLALLAVLIVGALAVYVGSQPPPLPAPFGRAANGDIAISRGGDISTVDPETGDVRVIVGGPEDDVDPLFSRDGSRIAFSRRVAGRAGFVDVYVVGHDGSGLTRVTDEPVEIVPTWKDVLYDFSTDSKSLVIAATRLDGRPGIMIAATDGGGVRWMDLEGIPAGTVATRPGIPTRRARDPPPRRRRPGRRRHEHPRGEPRHRYPAQSGRGRPPHADEQRGLVADRVRVLIRYVGYERGWPHGPRARC
jgi:hypothetical protein